MIWWSALNFWSRVDVSSSDYTALFFLHGVVATRARSSAGQVRTRVAWDHQGVQTSPNLLGRVKVGDAP
jgi:hypothetical protein